MEESGHDPHAISSVELLKRAQAGSRDALDQLCARHVAPLRRWARGRLPRWARELLDTEDLVQDTIMRTLRHIDHFQPRHDGALQAYLRHALHNRILEEIRRVRRRPMPEAVDLEPERGPSPLEHAVGQQALEHYESALAKLREEDRELIVLRVELGHTYEMLAQLLGKPSAAAARMAVMRAIMRLGDEIARER